MIKFNERLKYLRKSMQMSQQYLADKIGISKSSINMYERGEREPSFETLEAIADFFNCDMDYLLGKTDTPNKYKSFMESNPNINNIISLPKTKKVPLLGNIACGEPILAEENIEDFIRVNKDIPADFALRCKGDSMINARIFDGDIVYIRQQPDVENGEIAAVLINNEATLKRVYKYPHRVELRAENPTVKPFEYVDEEINSIRILGKAVAFTSTVR